MTAYQQPGAERETRKLRTVFIGDAATKEANAYARLEIHRYSDLSFFLGESPAPEEPELIILFQSFSDQFCPVEIGRLFKKYPLSRFLAAYGPLCESDGRTRNLLPQSIRVPFWRLDQRIDREVEVLTGKAAALPLTATREEAVHFEFQSLVDPSANKGCQQQAIVFSPDAIWAEMISDAWEAACQSQCLCMHTLGNLGRYLQAGKGYNGQIIIDIDPFNRSLKDWLTEHISDPGKNYTEDFSANRGHQSGHLSPVESEDNILKQAATIEESSIVSGQILAATNWLTPRCRKELEQLGVNRLVCKLNLPELLDSVLRR